MNSNYELDLISRTLNSETVICTSEITDNLDNLKKLINSSYKNLVEEGTFPQKAKTMEDINNICDLMDTMIRYPMCAGKTIVGIMADSITNRKKLIKDTIGIDEKKFNLERNTSIPAFYLNGDDGTFSVNKFDFITPLSTLDTQTMFNNLVRERKIDLAQGILSIINTQPIIYKDLVFILLPNFGKKYSKEFKLLLQLTDFMILSGSDNIHSLINYFKKIDYKHKIYLQNDENKTYDLGNLNIKHFNKSILDMENKPRYNINFHFQMDSILLNQINHYMEENKILESEIITLRKAMLIDEKDNDEIKKLRKVKEKSLKKNKELLNQIETKRNEIFEINKNIVKIITNESGININYPINEKIEEIYYKRGNKLINASYYKESVSVINYLKNNNSIKGSLLTLKFNSHKGMPLNENDIIELYNYDDLSQDIIKSKIHFSRQLKFNEKETIKLVNKLKRLTTNREYYLKAKYLKNIDIKECEKYLRLGAENNDNYCKAELYNLYIKKKDNIKDMEYLANLLHNDSNYYLAKYYKDKKFYRHLYYLKVAAALGNLDAKYELAKILYNKNTESALVLMEELLKSSYKEEDCLLGVGLCYYKLQQYPKATDVLEKCKNENAYYLLGKIYEFGNGRMKDLKKAMTYYKLASNLGNNNAKSRYLKIEARLEDIKRKNATRTGYYSSSSSYSSYSSSSSSTSNGLCFITTATCRALGKEDNCEEILRFKNFRDTYIISLKNGEELITTYYKVAPEIVRKIDNNKESLKIYKFIWENYLYSCNKYIINKEHDKAKDLYIKMVEDLLIENEIYYN